MGKNNLIHLKLSYDEALMGKKDIISSEINLLEISKRIKKYRELRSQELQTKINISNQIKKTRTNFNKLKTILPKLVIPKILERGKEEYPEIKEELFVETNSSLEDQLKKIEEKLRQL